MHDSIQTYANYYILRKILFYILFICNVWKTSVFFFNTTILETTRYKDRPSIRRMLRFIRQLKTCILIKENGIKFQQLSRDATMQYEACRNQTSLREVTTIGSSSTQTRAQYTHAHTRTHAHTYTHIHIITHTRTYIYTCTYTCNGILL